MNEVSVKVVFAPDEHHALKRLAVDRRTNMSDLIRELVRKEVEAAKDQPAKK